MIVTVASGKGGTGKTTVAVNLALSIGDAPIYDCDVEEPNVHVMLQPTELETREVQLPIPEVNRESCTLCGKCAEFCQFNAIFVGKNGVIVYPELCHSCGGCALVCPENAIAEVGHTVGQVHITEANGRRVVYGELTIGEPIATSVIKAVKNEVVGTEVSIIDAPPGTACPVIETMRDSDYLILVTEPTPFGLHDLKMTVDVVRELSIPFGVIVNKAGIGDDSVTEYCKGEGIPILMEIPFTRRIAELYSRGIPFVEELPEWRERFQQLFRAITEEVEHHDQ
ncbi:MAG: (4Fe-4S)-binding protein [Candidatus Thorarchaeota archaeon]|nr:MAG: (4Fe-4S)-binding protein [Candidatus Thorarchaeota archaeon]